MNRPEQATMAQPALPPSLEIGAGLPEEETEAVLLALGKAIEARDSTTGDHCERLAFHGLALGVAMGLRRHELLALYRGGFLHDIGKVGMPDSILFKPSGLNEEEWAAMRRHPLVGEQICRRLKILQPVVPIIRSHHERWDGSGYPDGLRGSGIPLLARVLQLVDIYDALTTTRPYKRAFTHREALGIMEEETARGWRDPELMDLFLGLHRKLTSAAEELSAASGDLSSMEASLRRLQRALARDAGPVPKPRARPNGATGP
jgi:putative two-component system response regulator